MAQTSALFEKYWSMKIWVRYVTVSFIIGTVRSGDHPKGPSGHGCCSDVLPPFSVSNQLFESNSVSSCGNTIRCNDKPALFKSFSMLSIHRCIGCPTGRFPVGSNYKLWLATSLYIGLIGPKEVGRNWKPTGKRPVGRPKQRWMDNNYRKGFEKS